MNLAELNYAGEKGEKAEGSPVGRVLYQIQKSGIEIVNILVQGFLGHML